MSEHWLKALDTGRSKAGPQALKIGIVILTATFAIQAFKRVEFCNTTMYTPEQCLLWPRSYAVFFVPQHFVVAVEIPLVAVA